MHFDNQMVITNINRLLRYEGDMWDLVSFAQSRARKACLEALDSGPKTPTFIAVSSGMNLSHISRALRELSTENLVECLTPNLTKNKIYQITPSGLKIIKKLETLDCDKEE